LPSFSILGQIKYIGYLMIISSKIVKRKYTELPILANILSQYFQYCERFALIKVQYQSFS